MREVAWSVAIGLMIATPGCIHPPDDGIPWWMKDNIYYHLLLAPETDILRVDIDYMEGAAPEMEAFDAAFDYIVEVSAIDRVNAPPPTLIQRTPDDRDLWSWLDREFDRGDGGPPALNPVYEGELWIHIVLLNEEVALEAQRHSWAQYLSGRILLFPMQYRGGDMGVADLAIGDPFWGVAEEKAVLVHEFGHAMGLVDAGIPMVTNRSAEDDPGHSSDEDSVMFPGVRRTNFTPGDFPIFDTIWRFNDNDLADIRAFQDRYGPLVATDSNTAGNSRS